MDWGVCNGLRRRNDAVDEDKLKRSIRNQNRDETSKKGEAGESVYLRITRYAIRKCPSSGCRLYINSHLDKPHCPSGDVKWKAGFLAFP